MKNWKLIAVFAATLIGTAMPAHAEIDLSANFGIMSDYIYRGFHQSDGVANGGIDLAAGPFYLGTWLADLDSGNGVEIDVYGGLAFEFENGFSVYVGYTAYRYTEDDDGVMEEPTDKLVSVVGDDGTVKHFAAYVDEGGNEYHLAPAHVTEETLTGVTGTDNEAIPDVMLPEGVTTLPAFADLMKVTIEGECVGGGFDQDYDEINLGVGYAQGDFSASLDYAIGEHENGYACSSEDNDYDIATLSLDYKGAYVTFGSYGISEDDEAKGEPEGDYVEVGYGTTINDIDFAVYLVDSDEDIDDETRLGMSVSYGFGL